MNSSNTTLPIFLATFSLALIPALSYAEHADGPIVLVTAQGDAFHFDRGTGEGSCAVLVGEKPAVYRFAGQIGAREIRGRFTTESGEERFEAQILLAGSEAAIDLLLPDGTRRSLGASVTQAGSRDSRGPESWVLTHVRGARWASGNLKAGIWLLGDFALYTGPRPQWKVNGIIRPAYPFIVGGKIVWIWLPATSALLDAHNWNDVSIGYVSGGQGVERHYRFEWKPASIPAAGERDFPAEPVAR